MLLSHAQTLITTATQMVELYRAMLRSQKSCECAALPTPDTVEELIKGLLDTRETMYRVIETHTKHILLEGCVEELPRTISLLHWSDWCTPERRRYVESFGLPSPFAENDVEPHTLFGQLLLDAVRARLFAISSDSGSQLSVSLATLFEDAATFYAVLYTERIAQERALFARLRFPDPDTVALPTRLGQMMNNE